MKQAIVATDLKTYTSFFFLSKEDSDIKMVDPIPAFLGVSNLDETHREHLNYNRMSELQFSFNNEVKFIEKAHIFLNKIYYLTKIE